MAAHSEIETDDNLRCTRVADRFERVKTHIATILAKSQLSCSKILSCKAKKRNASCLSHRIDYLTLGNENREKVETKYKSDSSSTEKEDSPLRRKTRTNREGLISQAEAAI